MERTPYVCTIARVKRARIDNVIFSGDDSVVGEAQGSREPEMRVRDTVPLRARLPVRARPERLPNQPSVPGCVWFVD